MQDPPNYGRRSKQVSELLKPGESGLGKLMARAREFERLDKKLSSLLDPELAARVKVATLSDHCLVLITPSAALATRLRMDAEQLLQTLQATGEKGIREIRVRVVPFGRGQEIPSPRRELPEIARRSLERFAADSGDAELEAIVQRKNTRTTGE